MLNSDLDLDAKPSPVARSISPQDRQIATELSIDAVSHRRCQQSIAMPIFTDATAQAARLTDSPVAILTTIAGSGYRISSIFGAEKFTRLAVNADLYSELAGLDYCHAQTINGGDKFVVANLQDEPRLSQSQLYCSHQIQAYLGVPIITAARDLLGAISVLDFNPHQFSDRDLEILHLISRSIASEFERKRLSQAQLDRWVGDLRYSDSAVRGFDDLTAAVEHDLIAPNSPSVVGNTSSDAMNVRSIDLAVDRVVSGENCVHQPQIQSEIQFKLLTHLAQELRTPLTSVIGMASVLQQEIYGPLSSKQKDYLGIIHHSGQQLVTIVNEISQLGGFDRQQHKLILKSVDLEMLCRLALQSLESLTQKKHQQIILDLSAGKAPQAPGNEKIWLLDKDKVRQIVYYLSLSLIYHTAPHHQISIQLFDLTDGLQLQLVTNDDRVILQDLQPIDNLATTDEAVSPSTQPLDRDPHEALESIVGQDLRIRLGLSLSQTLAIAHGGKIEVLTDRLGYQLSLPLIVADDDEFK